MQAGCEIKVKDMHSSNGKLFWHVFKCFPHSPLLHYAQQTFFATRPPIPPKMCNQCLNFLWVLQLSQCLCNTLGVKRCVTRSLHSKRFHLSYCAKLLSHPPPPSFISLPSFQFWCNNSSRNVCYAGNVMGDAKVTTLNYVHWEEIKDCLYNLASLSS